MNLRKSQSKSDVEVLLKHGRVIAALPGSVRARVVARARATAETTPTQLVDMPAATRHRGSAIALAAAVAFIVGAAGAVVALRVRSHEEPRVTQSATPHVQAAACANATPAAAPPASPAPQPSVERREARAEPSLTPRESYTVELGLLQRAQAAYADRNFATTLLLVGEHARRFPNGRLAEEREALRVKALLGTGREAEARKAAAAFTTRFPRSAFLPRLNHESSGGN